MRPGVDASGGDSSEKKRTGLKSEYQNYSLSPNTCQDIATQLYSTVYRRETGTIKEFIECHKNQRNRMRRSLYHRAIL